MGITCSTQNFESTEINKNIKNQSFESIHSVLERPQLYKCLFFDSIKKRWLTKEFYVKFDKQNEVVHLNDGQKINLKKKFQASDCEILENFEQIIFLKWVGKYHQNMKIDKWTVNWNGLTLYTVGGYYSKNQKLGFWKDLFKNYCSNVSVFEIGEYYNNRKIGYWVYFFQQKKIGGGRYDQKAIQRKIGKWEDLHDYFCDDAQIINYGEYNNFGMKIGLWDILYREHSTLKFKSIGGGLYSSTGDHLKIGKWVELDKGFTNVNQIIYEGEYNANGMKIGNWATMYWQFMNDDLEKIGGGTYDQERGQLKIGMWVELDEEFRYQKQVIFNGEYNIKGFKIGRWDIMIRESRKNPFQKMQILLSKRNIISVLSGGGSYDQEGGHIKKGEWIELDKDFMNEKKVSYKGEYNVNGIKIGKWDILQLQFNNCTTEKIGGGFYEKNGSQLKIGYWVELDDQFKKQRQITFNGEYNIKGMKIGQWLITFRKSIGDIFEKIGGGSFDQAGDQRKIGKWVELDEKFNEDNQMISYGQYHMNGKKVGRWDSFEQKVELFIWRKIIYYDFQSNQSKEILIYSPIFYKGQLLDYKKVGKWEAEYNGQQLQRGGGSYDQGGNQKKIGKWVEPDEGFYDLKQITHKGEYNLNDMKVGRWDIMYCKWSEKKYQLIGGGSYDQGGNQKKIGYWHELDEGFQRWKEVTHYGKYNENGMKVDVWDIYFRRYGDKEFQYAVKQMYKYSGGGSYDQKGDQKKIGQWIELDTGFSSGQVISKQITYIGHYNKEGQKVGKWIERDKRNNIIIGEKNYGNGQDQN